LIGPGTAVGRDREDRVFDQYPRPGQPVYQRTSVFVQLAKDPPR
jgi:hypothetical protein